jgi:hypothetical protein
LKRPLFRPPLARRGVARAEGGRAARSRPARSRADVLSFPSVPEWPRADRALGLAAVERETADLRIISARLFPFFPLRRCGAAQRRQATGPHAVWLRPGRRLTGPAGKRRERAGESASHGSCALATARLSRSPQWRGTVDGEQHERRGATAFAVASVRLARREPVHNGPKAAACSRDVRRRIPSRSSGRPST